MRIPNTSLVNHAKLTPCLTKIFKVVTFAMECSTFPSVREHKAADVHDCVHYYVAHNGTILYTMFQRG